jgi:hypothetical protein
MRRLDHPNERSRSLLYANESKLELARRLIKLPASIPNPSNHQPFHTTNPSNHHASSPGAAFFKTTAPGAFFGVRLES